MTDNNIIEEYKLDIEMPYELKVRRVENGFIVSYLEEIEDNKYILREHACEDGADREWYKYDVSDTNKIKDEELSFVTVCQVMRDYFGVFYDKHRDVNLEIGFKDYSN